MLNTLHSSIVYNVQRGMFSLEKKHTIWLQEIEGCRELFQSSQTLSILLSILLQLITRREEGSDG